MRPSHRALRFLSLTLLFIGGTQDVLVSARPGTVKGKVEEYGYIMRRSLATPSLVEGPPSDAVMPVAGPPNNAVVPVEGPPDNAVISVVSPRPYTCQPPVPTTASTQGLSTTDSCDSMSTTAASMVTQTTDITYTLKTVTMRLSAPTGNAGIPTTLVTETGSSSTKVATPILSSETTSITATMSNTTSAALLPTKISSSAGIYPILSSSKSLTTQSSTLVYSSSSESLTTQPSTLVYPSSSGSLTTQPSTLVYSSPLPSTSPPPTTTTPATATAPSFINSSGQINISDVESYVLGPSTSSLLQTMSGGSAALPAASTYTAGSKTNGGSGPVMTGRVDVACDGCVKNGAAVESTGGAGANIVVGGLLGFAVGVIVWGMV